MTARDLICDIIINDTHSCYSGVAFDMLIIAWHIASTTGYIM